MFPHGNVGRKKVKNFWPLLDSLVPHHWTEIRGWEGGGGCWARFVPSSGLFLIVQMSIDGRWFSSTNLHGSRSMSRYNYDEFVFVSVFLVFLLSGLAWPTRTGDKKRSPHKKSPRQRHGMASISSSNSSAWLYRKQYGSMKDVVQEPRIRNRVWTWGKKRREKPCCSSAVQLKWKLMGILFDPSVLFRCGSIRKRYDARFV